MNQLLLNARNADINMSKTLMTDHLIFVRPVIFKAFQDNQDNQKMKHQVFAICSSHNLAS